MPPSQLATLVRNLDAEDPARSDLELAHLILATIGLPILHVAGRVNELIHEFLVPIDAEKRRSPLCSVYRLARDRLAGGYPPAAHLASTSAYNPFNEAA